MGLSIKPAQAPRLASAIMGNDPPHISVCICTYKRRELLQRLLGELRHQDAAGLFTFSIVVADNDSLQSAKEAVAEFASESAIPIKYCVEPQQNIALTRNTAIKNADGDFIAFIDDDEFPAKDWLWHLFKACQEYHADGVLGPVKRHFDEEPPKWIVKGNFYERPTHPTGFVISWRGGRTGNLLLKKQLFEAAIPRFDRNFVPGRIRISSAG